MIYFTNYYADFEAQYKYTGKAGATCNYIATNTSLIKTTGTGYITASTADIVYGWITR